MTELGSVAYFGSITITIEPFYVTISRTFPTRKAFPTIVIFKDGFLGPILIGKHQGWYKIQSIFTMNIWLCLLSAESVNNMTDSSL